MKKPPITVRVTESEQPIDLDALVREYVALLLDLDRRGLLPAPERRMGA